MQPYPTRCIFLMYMAMIHSDNLPLLNTKLYVPVMRENLVKRSRLHKQLAAGENSKLILITAAAGAGKTTLVISWLAQQNKQAAWLSLDKNDNDPLIFLTYVAAALQTIEAGVCETIKPLLISSDPPPIPILLTYFVNDMACLKQPSILVLDDYHAITNAHVHKITEFLIENAPPTLQIIMTSRVMPDISVSRLRARNQLVEISDRDLRFSDEESWQFLHHVMQLHLSQAEASDLNNRTEGWVTGLQLAAIGLRSQPGAGEFIHELGGDDRLIGDYLVDEVIEQQSLEVRQFLGRTSILHQFSASLCNAVLGIHNAQEMLLYLEHANLFLVSLDNRRGWYRYHHLFGDMLRSRLQQKRPEMIPQLYQRAVAWHLENGLTAEAIDYTIEAGDYEQTAVLIEKYWGQFQTGSRRIRIIQWAEAIPETILKQHDLLWSQYILALFYFASFDTALDALKRLWHTDPIDENKLRLVRALENPLLAAITLHTTLDAQRVLDLSQQALAVLPENNSLMRGIALGHSGSASLYLGDLPAASRYLVAAVELIECTYSWSIITVFRNYLAETEAVQGHLVKAAEQYRQLQHFVCDHGLQEGHTFASTQIGLGMLYYEWNQLEEAERLIREGRRLAETSNSLEVALYAYRASSKLKLAIDQSPDVKEKLDQIEVTAASFQFPPLVMDRIEALRSWLALRAGNLVNGQSWARSFSHKREQQISYLQQFEWLTVARIHLETGREDECLRLLQALQKLALEQNRLRDWIWIGALLVRTWYQAGETHLALSKLNNLLAAAEPEGYIRSFVDPGPIMQELLLKVLAGNGRSATNAPSPAYIQRILAAFPEKSDEKRPLAPTLLTPRELEILQLLADGHAYKQISAELVISENTLKTHIKRIYSKLNVHNRMNAVLVAQDMELL